MVSPISTDVILSATHYTDIFDNPDTMKKDYLLLCKLYHPDLHKSNALAVEVMTKINELYQASLAGSKLADGLLYYYKGLLIYKDKIVFTPSNLDLYKKNLPTRFASDDMRKEFTRYFPAIKNENTGSIECFFEDAFSLREILQRGPMPERHVAWMMNRLYNICSYFEWAGFSHNGLSLDNCLISPKNHVVMIIGGWEHCMPFKEELKSMDVYSYEAAPNADFGTPISVNTNDIYAIRKIGLDLLQGGNKSFVDFLSGPIEKTTLEDYKKWSNLVIDNFGKPTFLEYKVWR